MANTKHQECEAPEIMPDAPAKTNHAAVAVLKRPPVVEDEFPEEVPEDTDPELDAAEAAENAHADEIIANLKDDDEDY